MADPGKHVTGDESAPDYETEHTGDAGSGVIRAGVFGVSDGLVSNLALVMGVAGGSGGNREAILIAGLSGLIAGAFSMAAGEYISMQTQKEVLERELQIERRHILEHPEEEAAALAAILTESGILEQDALRITRAVHRKVGPALSFHARFELGIVPEELGTPLGAALSSFVAFFLGAVTPLLPFFFADGVMYWSVGLSAIGLLAIGVAMTKVTGQSMVWGGARQLLVGAAAAGVTYLVGLGFGTLV